MNKIQKVEDEPPKSYVTINDDDVIEDIEADESVRLEYYPRQLLSKHYN